MRLSQSSSVNLSVLRVSVLKRVKSTLEIGCEVEKVDLRGIGCANGLVHEIWKRSL